MGGQWLISQSFFWGFSPDFSPRYSEDGHASNILNVQHAVTRVWSKYGSFQFCQPFSHDFVAIAHLASQGGMDEDDLTWMAGGDKSPVGCLRPLRFSRVSIDPRFTHRLAGSKWNDLRWIKMVLLTAYWHVWFRAWLKTPLDVASKKLPWKIWKGKWQVTPARALASSNRCRDAAHEIGGPQQI